VKKKQKIEIAKDYILGKNPTCKKRKRVVKAEPLWHLKVSLQDLPYWSTLKLLHNLDVMHIEKNICDNIVGTLLENVGKNKETISARVDLKKMNIRSKFWMKYEGENCIKPHAP
jgi:hypothetical protein